MEIIYWIIIGALAGWIASMIMKTDAEQGAIGNVIVGILGAVIGGFLAESLLDKNVDGTSVTGLIVAVIGAVILLAIVKAFRGGRPAGPRVE